MRLPNLLPLQYKKAYRVYLTLSYLRTFLAWQAMVIIALGAGLFALQTFYHGRLQSLSQSESNLQAVQEQINIAELKALASDQNDKLKVAASILKVRPALSIIMRDLSSRIPVGVTLDSVKLDTTTSQLTVDGRAATRDQVVLLQNQLEQSDLWKVNFAPLSNLTESQNANFTFILQFNLKDVTKIQ